jgi:N-acetylglucosaminyldiphosphoundecaprenol N-acetyl-beta-D-mannosaminyltransferase
MAADRCVKAAPRLRVAVAFIRDAWMAMGGSHERRTTESVLDVTIDCLGWNDAVARIMSWSSTRDSRSVCICNVHSLVTAGRSKSHARSLEAADMVTPDGAPVAWMLRVKGQRHQKRISGPDLMLACCELAAENGEKVFLYGGSQAVLDRLQAQLKIQFPELQIVGAYSPPYRDLTPDEDDAVVNLINQSGAGIVWVGLGCPKQELWMHLHRGRIQAVMVGVGAAFDFHAGAIKRAPLWMQNNGLEWLHRLSQDPRRLAKRYLVTNTVFVWRAMRELRDHKRRMRLTRHARETA